MDDVYSVSTGAIAGEEETSDSPNNLQQATDTGDSSGAPFVHVPGEPVKRKRGRPKKQHDQLPKPSIDAVTVDIVTENALKVIQDSMGLVQASAENHEESHFTNIFKDKTIKRGRGRPKKNSFPPPPPMVELIGLQEIITIQPPIEVEIGESSSPKKKGRGRPRKIPLALPDCELQHEQLDTPDKFKGFMSEPMFAEPAKLLRALPECEVTKSQVYIAQVEGPSTTLHLLKDKNLTSSPSESTFRPVKGTSDLAPNESTSKPVVAPLPSVGGVVQSDTSVIKRKRGRPPKNSLPSAQAPVVKKACEEGPQQNFQDEKSSHDPIVKRRPGRPRKNPDVNNTPTEPKVKRKPGRPRKNLEDQQEQKTTRKRGRPKKDQSSDLFLDVVIPAQSSEPIVKNSTQHLDPFPSITLDTTQVFSNSLPEDSQHCINTRPITDNLAGRKNNGGFKLQLSSTEDESADSASIAMAIVTLSGGDLPRPNSLLINESFDESFDDED